MDWVKEVNDSLADHGLHSQWAVDLRAYIFEGKVGNPLIRALFENDLTTSAMLCWTRYQDVSLVRIARFVVTTAPANSWGNAERVLAWVDRGGLNGEEKKTPHEEEQ